MWRQLHGKGLGSRESGASRHGPDRAASKLCGDVEILYQPVAAMSESGAHPKLFPPASYGLEILCESSDLLAAVCFGLQIFVDML